MIKEAIDRIVDLAVKPDIISLHERKFWNNGDGEIKPYRPAPMDFHSLSGFTDYIKTLDAQPQQNGGKKAAGASEQLLIHVVSPHLVALVSGLDLVYQDRKVYARAQYNAERIFKFGQSMEPEVFIIALQTLFAESEGRTAILALAGNMTEERVSTSEDDGISQTVGRRISVALQERQTIQNPVFLKPLRTFSEIEQPESPFIFRVHQRDDELPRPALYECDNGAWRLLAMQDIRNWLSDKVGGIPVLA